LKEAEEGAMNDSDADQEDLDDEQEEEEGVIR
jgi:hypothetical protein